MNERESLRSLLVTRSLKLGDFTLASGARSRYYVDARRTTMTAEGQRLLGIVGLAAIREAGWEASHIGGLTLGADPVTYAVAHRSAIASARGELVRLDGFTVRKQAKEYGTGQRIEGGLPAGARCIVVEDSMTTGGSALQAVEAVLEHGAEVVGVLTVVDREEGGRERLAESGLDLLALFTASELLEVADASAD